MATVRAEETRRSVTYRVEGEREDGSPCTVILTVTATCQEPGSRKAVDDTYKTARVWLEKGL